MASSLHPVQDLEIRRESPDPAAVRGHGGGSVPLGALEARMRDDGLELALLETGTTQRVAPTHYEGAGCRRRGAFADYPDNGRSLCLEKRLGS